MAARYNILDKIAETLPLLGVAAGQATEQGKMVVYGNLPADSPADEVKIYPGSRAVMSNEPLSKYANRTCDGALQHVFYTRLGMRFIIVCLIKWAFLIQGSLTGFFRSQFLP